MTIVYLKATAISDPDSNINSGTVANIDEGVNGGTPDGQVVGSVTNVWSGGKTWTINVEDVPGDFSSANSALVRGRALVGGTYVNDTLAWSMSVTGTNAPSGAQIWAASIEAGLGFRDKATTADTGVSAASAANINGWQITIVQSGSTVKSADDLYFDLDGVEIELDYNASADTDITTNTPPSMTTTTYKPSIDYNLYPGFVAMTTSTHQATVSLDVSITTNTPPSLSTTVYPVTLALDRNVTTGTPPAMSTTVYPADVTVGVTIATNTPPAMATTTYPVTFTFDRNVTTGAPAAMTATPHQASVALDVAITTGTPPSLATTTYPVTFTFDRNVTTGAPPSLTTATYSQTVDLFTGTNVFVNAPPAMTVVTYNQTVAGQRGAAGGTGGTGLWFDTFQKTFK